MKYKKMKKMKYKKMKYKSEKKMEIFFNFSVLKKENLSDRTETFGQEPTKQLRNVLVKETLQNGHDCVGARARKHARERG